MLAMERLTTSSSTESAREFIEAWDAHYEHGVSEIRLFDPSATKSLDFAARHYLIKALYHARSGLADLLIQMAYHAPDRRMKDKAMENIAEELNGDEPSHEQLFARFAESLGVDLTGEYVERRSEPPYLRDFHTRHRLWFLENSFDAQVAAFAAYERLDNPDYLRLRALAESLGATGEALEFFIIHTEVRHFEMLEDDLLEVWDRSPDSVRRGFHFIGNAQLMMWGNLSEDVFSRSETRIAA